MAFDADPILNAIRDVVLSNSGSVRTIASTRFSGSVYASLDEDTKSQRALVAPRIEPSIVSFERNPFSPSIMSNLALMDIEIDVLVVRNLHDLHKVDDEVRHQVRALANEDAQLLFEALTYPSNLTTDGSGTATNLVSGHLKYISSALGDVQLTDDGAGIVESVHRFMGTVKVTLPT